MPEITETENTEDLRPIVRNHYLYLGQTKLFTDLNQNVYPESFWIKGVVVDPFLKTFEIRNYGFKSIDDFNRGGLPFNERESDVSNILFRGEAFDRIVAANGQLVGGVIMAMKSIQSLIKDYPSESGEGMISFFDNAVNVEFPK